MKAFMHGIKSDLKNTVLIEAIQGVFPTLQIIIR